jgi:hypothetical protein
MLLVNFKYVNSARALFIFILILASIFIAMPEFLYFVIKESSSGHLVWGEAFLALLISCFGGIIFTVILWLIIEPMRKKRELLLKKSPPKDA